MNMAKASYCLALTVAMALGATMVHAQACFEGLTCNTAPAILNPISNTWTTGIDSQMAQTQSSLNAISASTNVQTIVQYITTSQTYVVPSDTTAGMLWHVDCSGAGGSGGAGQTLNQSPGGGAAACFSTRFNGLSPTSTIVFSLGTPGAAVTSGAGIAGTSTTMLVNGVTTIAGGGDAGGTGTTAVAGRGGITSGCSLPSCLPINGGGAGVTGSGPGGYGGASCFGGGARETQAGAAGDAGRAPGSGGAGGGNGGANASGAGGIAACILRRFH